MAEAETIFRRIGSLSRFREIGIKCEMHKFWETPIPTTVAPEGVKVPESLEIGNVRISPATILAPMAGVTDTVFRRFIRNASFVTKPETILAAPGEARSPETNEMSGCGLLMT